MNRKTSIVFLVEHLILYNIEKVHYGIGKVPPLHYYLYKFVTSYKKSNIHRTLTELLTTSNHLFKLGPINKKINTSSLCFLKIYNPWGKAVRVLLETARPPMFGKEYYLL